MWVESTNLGKRDGEALARKSSLRGPDNRRIWCCTYFRKRGAPWGSYISDEEVEDTVKKRTHLLQRILGYELRTSPVSGIAHDLLFFVKLEPV